MIHGLDLDDTTRPPVARVVSSGIPIDSGQVHKVWRGLVQVPGCMEPAVPVAFKWMPGQHKLPIELACALAGAELGVPVPGGLVVLSQRDQMPGLGAAAKPMPGSDDYLCFGSLLQWPDDSAARLLDSDGAEEHTWQQLCARVTAAAPAAAWDELAANADRHTDNFVYDGHKYWLIDHELALQPIARMVRTFAVQTTRQRLIDHRAKDNAIAHQLARRRPNDHFIMAQPRRFQAAELRIKLLADRVRQWPAAAPELASVWQITEVVLRGIALRLSPLGLMLGQRLAIPDARSLWNSSSPTPDPTPPPRR